MFWFASSVIALLFFAMADLSGAEPADAQLAAEWQTAWQFSDAYEKMVDPLPVKPRTTVERDIEAEIAAPPAQVFAAFASLHRSTEGARVIVHSSRQMAGEQQVDFTEVRTVDVDGSPREVKTHGKLVARQSSLSIDSRTWTSPNIATRQQVEFVDLGGGRTRVVQHLRFHAPGPLAGYAVSTGVSAYRQVLDDVKADLELRRR